ncbi:MAG: fumarylacetoacetate hydrolase family protein [Alphaproteobacteria bacterium]|nr:fumarylacetoacetate hydrolase family protein [Alphaproteobacteria bacterium]
MKLVSYRDKDGDTFGTMVGDGIFNIGRSAEIRCSTLREALEAGALDAIRELVLTREAYTPVEDVTFLPVIPDPDKIICVGLNYATHVAEGGREPPEYPMLFPRYANTQVGHGEALTRPKASERFDFEGELAFVVGKAARHVPQSEALDYVAGYACYNDGSVRDWQRHTSQFLPGKNFVGSGGFGPWLVTSDEIPDPTVMTLTTRLNGTEMQRATTDDLIFGVARLIEYISTFTELVPGDVVATGTTGGVGAYREPPVWMKAGDTVEVEISGIGTLRNTVVDEVG